MNQGAITASAIDGAGMQAEFQKPLFEPNTRAKICALGPGPGVETGEFLLESAVPLFDRLSDGTWIVSDARCEYGAENARVIGSDGSVLSRFCLGDGIGYLQCDAAGKIWAGYFDEGIFGSFGWGSPNPEPIGASGLVRFSSSGQIDWSYRPGRQGEPWIADCYALNVGRQGVWCCTYTDFPILRIDSQGSPKVWRNDVAGARALAVSGRYAALLGGYNDEANRVAVLTLEEEAAISASVYELDVGNLKFADLVIGRGEWLHVVSDRKWYSLSVDDLLAGR